MWSVLLDQFVNSARMKNFVAERTLMEFQEWNPERAVGLIVVRFDLIRHLQVSVASPDSYGFVDLNSFASIEPVNAALVILVWMRN